MNTKFPATRWTLIGDAAGEDRERRESALAEIYRAYWFPLYTWARRSGQSAHDAEDSVAGFFAKLFTEGRLKNIDTQGGRLRSYLLAALKNFQRSEHRAATAAKRGGGAVFSLNEAEARYQNVADTGSTPDEAFDRQWAMALLGRCFERLRAYYEEARKSEHYELLEPVLAQSGKHVNFAELGARLGMAESAARVTAFRMRKRLRAFLEEEAASTTGDATAAAAELDLLRRILSGSTA